MNLPCGGAFGSTCWNGIFGYLGNCLITISGFAQRSGSMPIPHFSGETHRISGNLPQSPIIWGTNYPHDVEQLILVIPSPEEGDARDHLCKDTATRPDIDGGAVRSRAKEDVGSAIPQRDDLRMSESSEGRANVTPRTSFEKVLTGTPNALARPKSPIFNSPFLLINRFCGLRSRWRTRFS